jgi:SAM-dependent methyltransferase
MTSTLALALEQKRYWQQDQSHRRKPGHPVIEAIYEPRAEFMRSLVEDLPSPSILDVGCGTGVMTHYLRKCFSVVGGVDFSETMLRENPLSCRVCGDAARLPFAAGSFDVVTCSHLLHHMPPASRLEAVKDFGRIARRWVVLYEPNRNNPAMLLFGLVKKAERMALAFSRRYMVGLAASAGLKVQCHRVECAILPNKTPPSLLRLARFFDRRPWTRLGFYTVVAAIPRGDTS